MINVYRYWQAKKYLGEVEKTIAALDIEDDQKIMIRAQLEYTKMEMEYFLHRSKIELLLISAACILAVIITHIL